MVWNQSWGHSVSLLLWLTGSIAGAIRILVALLPDVTSPVIKGALASAWTSLAGPLGLPGLPAYWCLVPPFAAGGALDSALGCTVSLLAALLALAAVRGKLWGQVLKSRGQLIDLDTMWVGATWGCWSSYISHPHLWHPSWPVAMFLGP